MGCDCALFIPVKHIIYPETANRKLEAIGRFFKSEPSLFIRRNRKAVQLARPIEYAEVDEHKARQGPDTDQ
jgi:hypothetical protein